MKAVILVGGQGTRLRPLTVDTPKPLVPLANRPFLEHVLYNLASHGVSEAILVTGYLASLFEEFPAERRHGVELTVVREEEPLGTCGAVKNVEEMLDETFLVLNGDILTNLDLTALLAAHQRKQAVGTLTLTPVRDPSAYGLVPIDDDGRIEAFIEKPKDEELVTNLVNAGTYVLEPDALKYAPAGRNYSFERGLFPTLLRDGEALYGFRSNAYWLDVGTPEKYRRGNRDVLEGRVGMSPEGEQTPLGAWLGRDVEVDDTVRLFGPAAIGPGSRIEANAQIHALTSLGRDCLVGEQAMVDDSVVHDGVMIEAGAIVERAVLCTGVRVGANSRITDAVVGPGVDVGADNELCGGIRLWPGVTLPDGTVRF